ncbi:membrane or secreted protein [Rhodopirellula sp. ICT_H3.1]|uniref:Membrane or secreted protein n=1 Tax=Aporhodopirellula aestuarii TaxID=2950107 RepID=A0ABT0U178_9BACT|nr:membrane or secreted protein [Aporhodopirellula aestuarii]
MIGCGPSGRDLSDAQWLQLQSDLQRERTEVGRQRDQLEADRRQWDERERREPVLAATIDSSVRLLCCIAPVLVVVLLLWPRQAETPSEVACDVLLDELIVQRDPGKLESSRANSPAYTSHKRLV